MGKQEGEMSMKEKTTRCGLWALFVNMLYLSTFTFGGGYVILGMMKDRFVTRYGWLTQDELFDITALAQSVPGPIAVNGAFLLGKHLCGAKGAMAATAGAVLPPLIILSALATAYRAVCENRYVAAAMRGMAVTVSASVVSVAYDLMKQLKKSRRYFLAYAMTAVAFCLSAFTGLNVAFVILGSALLGFLVGALEGRQKK